MTTKENLTSRESWVRGLYILLFGLFYSIAEIVLWAIVLFQFVSHLLLAKPNERLLHFTHGLNAYIYQILQFITYHSDEMPFPFTDWPDDEGEPATRRDTMPPPGEANSDTGEEKDPP